MIHPRTRTHVGFLEGAETLLLIVVLTRLVIFVAAAEPGSQEGLEIVTVLTMFC
jgi:hypothetical protein